MFSHLHLHTEYSLLDSTTKVTELFKRVKELGMDSVAITEHGTMLGMVKKYKEAKKAGVKLIFGVELYTVKDRLIQDKDEPRSHILLLAENETGLKNLMRLVSIAHTEGFYYKPRVDMPTLEKYKEGIICTSACIANEIARAITSNKEDLAEELIEKYKGIFGKDNFFLEVENHGIEEEARVAEAYFRLGPKHGIKIMCGGDAHYLKKEHKKAHSALLCVQSKTTLSDPKRFKFSGDGYWVQSEEEVRRGFPDHQEVYDNAHEIARRCNVELDLGKTIFPDFEIPKGLTAAEQLERLTWRRFKDRYGKKTYCEQARIQTEFELRTINRMGFAEYFLILEDLITNVRDKTQIGPGRGSAAGSCVAYILGLTQVDPLSYGLLFERFLNPDRISLPDIDTDFGDKQKAIDYFKMKYGAEKFALIGTFGTLSAKAAIKDVCRAYGVSFYEINQLIHEMEMKTIDEGLSIYPELANFAKQHEEVFEVAKILEGIKRHKSQHACGVVLGKSDIMNYLPVWSSEGHFVTQVDMDEVEDLGLVKFDLLGVETLNVIGRTLEFIGKSGEWVQNIPLDDASVYEMLKKGYSDGVFQVEGEGMRQTLRAVEPSNMEELCLVLALYRPGTMQFIDTYAARKRGEEEIVPVHKKVEEVLRPTLGIYAYQEQIMQLTRILAGFTPGEADTLRKGFAKKKAEIIHAMEPKFKEGCKKYSEMSSEEVNKLWDNILRSSDYLFNKSHALSYAYISYRTAYLKKHYPVEFMTATLCSNIGEQKNIKQYCRVIQEMNIPLLPPDVNEAVAGFSTNGKAVRFGLEAIKGVSGVSLKEILNNRPYNNFQDFVNKVNTSKVNRRVMKHMISVGCFDSLGENRGHLLSIVDDISPEVDGSERQMSLSAFGMEGIKVRQKKDLTLKDKIGFEIELLGVPVSGSIMDLYPQFKGQGEPFKIEGEATEFFAIMTRHKKVLTKREQREMAFCTMQYGNFETEAVIFPQLYENYSNNYGPPKEGLGYEVQGYWKNGTFIIENLKRVVEVQD